MINILMQWGSPQNVFYGLLVVAAWMLLAYRFFVWCRIKKLLKLPASITRYIIKTVLYGVAVTAVWIALLSPQWDEKEKIVQQQGRDVLIALDISRSMLAQDCVPDRLACAKQKIHDLLMQLQSERVGLLLFAGDAIMQCPLTTDYSAFYLFLDQVDNTVVSSGTTALDAVIRKALAVYKKQKNGKTKLLVIFTDGEDFSSHLTDIKQEAHAQGISIFTIGIGTEKGAPIPVYDEQGKQVGHQKDKKDAVVISRLNEGILKSIARDCGGTYISMTADNRDINALVSCVEAFEKDVFDDKKITRYEEQYPYFIGIGFICLLGEWLL